MAVAASAVIPVAKAAGEVSKVLTGDLVVIKGQVFRAIKRRVPTGELTPTGRPQMVTQEVLVPIEVEAHVNPLSIGLGLAGLGIGLGALALGAWWAGIGVKLNPEVQDQIRLNLKTIVVLEGWIADLEGTLAECTARCEFLYAEERFREQRLACIAACEAGVTPEKVIEWRAEIKRLKGENSRLRLKILQLTERDRMSPSLFRIF